MALHHTKHHQAYTNNLNAGLEAHGKADTANDAYNRTAVQAGIHFNAGGYINHCLFWLNLAPASYPSTSLSNAAPKLSAALISDFGSVEEFKAKFSAFLLSIKGSGWGWLVLSDDQHLSIVQTKDQDVVSFGRPLLGVDMWEHAYYLQYLNEKEKYVESFWCIVNWETVEKRFVDSSWWDEWKDVRSYLIPVSEKL